MYTCETENSIVSGMVPYPPQQYGDIYGGPPGTNGTADPAAAQNGAANAYVRWFWAVLVV